MTFIIALGIIIILLCSASVFKLMQPKEDTTRRVKKASSPKKAPKPKLSVKEPEILPTKAPLSEQEPAALTPFMSEAEPITQPVVDIPSVISLNLYADADRSYAGYEFLQALLSAGLRFGLNNMFHRHTKKTGVGPVLFSLAACTESGQFDLAKIGAFSCKGVVLFMHAKEVDDAKAAFELMLETADELVSELGGKVLNDKQQLLKKEDVIDLHNRLCQYMQGQKSVEVLD